MADLMQEGAAEGDGKVRAAQGSEPGLTFPLGYAERAPSSPKGRGDFRLTIVAFDAVQTARIHLPRFARWCSLATQ